MTSFGREERVRRVLTVLRAAARIADPRDPVGQEARRVLPDATGLSAANVELALRRHLETEVGAADLERLIARAGSASRVHVLLSANVFVGVVRAVAVAMAAAPAVFVRASSRDAVMPHLLRRAWVEAGDPPFELVDELAPSPGDEWHVYGRDETIAAVAQHAPPGVRLRGHGAGFGVALVDVDGKTAALVREAAEALSWDIVPFDQRGCLSPRIVFFVGSARDATEFASALATELDLRNQSVPRGHRSEDERQAGTLYLSTLRAVGYAEVGGSFVVGLDPAPRALVLPPPGRHVHVVPVCASEQLDKLLRPWSSAVTCVGYANRTGDRSSHAKTLRILTPGARWSPLGSMQTPPLDGPVDLRAVL
jgi:hypothetical protein